MRVTYLLCKALYLHIVASVFDVGNEPVVLLGAPLGTRLNLHVLDGGDELVDDEVLKTDLSCELSDPVHKIFSLAMDHLSNVIKLALRHPVTRLDTLHFTINLLKLLLMGGVVVT